MSLEKFIDEQIKKAIASGDFVNLPGVASPWICAHISKHRRSEDVLLDS